MTPERFRTIVAAYGSDARRWPDPERADAEAWALEHLPEASAMLDAAAELDGWLAGDTLASPTRALVERIVAAAPAPPRTRPRGHAWWSGAACAGVGLAGAAAGAIVGAVAVSTLMFGSVPTSHEPSYLTTTFGGPSVDWSEE